MEATLQKIQNSVQSWKNRIEWLTQSTLNRALDNLDGEPVVFEWKISPGHTTPKLFQEVQHMMEKAHSQPEDVKDRIIFMSM